MTERILDALDREIEADEAMAAVAKMTEEEIERGLVASGYDLDAARARARAQIDAFVAGRGAKVVPLRTRRAAAILLVAAIAAGVLFFLGRPRDPGEPDPPVASPASAPDAGRD